MDELFALSQAIDIGQYIRLRPALLGPVAERRRKRVTSVDAGSF